MTTALVRQPEAPPAALVQLRAPASSARLARLQRVRTGRRVRRNLGTLTMMLLILTAGFALTLTFFVGSTSVVRGLHDFFDSHHQQAGSFLLDPRDEQPDETGIVAHEAADVGALEDATLRVLAPRDSLDRHQVVAGRDLDGPGEILVNRLFAEEREVELGSRIEVGGSSWQVVGFLTTPDYVSVKSNQLVLQPNHEAFGIGMVTAEDFAAEFADRSYRTYAYDSSHTTSALVDRYEPLDLRPVVDDSRVQIALTDAEGPRDLAFLVFLLFLAIAGALLAVYHLRVRTTDELNNEVFRQAGLGRGLRRHQKTETRALLVLSWLLSCGLAIVFVRPMMRINGELYDFPLIEVRWSFLVGCAAVGLACCLVLDEATYRLANRATGEGRRGGGPPRWRGVGLARLGFVPDFGYRYKLVRMVRRPGESLAVVFLVLVVGLFTTFSLNLKWSVEDWVDSLAPTTPYDRMYDLSGFTEPPPPRPGQEQAAVATLYAHGAAQSVFRVPEASAFVGDVPGATVTRAFADKYGTDIGDVVELEDVTGRTVTRVDVEAIREQDTASALIYVPEEGWTSILPADTSFAPLLLSDHPDDRLEDQVPTVTRSDVEDSGASIIRVIDAQVSLLLVLAAALLVVLFTAITTFTRSTQAHARRIMEREGIPPRSIRRSLFGGVTVLALLSVTVAGLLAGVVVRVFLDGIMGRFVNFVPVTATTSSLLVALVGVVALMQLSIAISGRESRPSSSRRALARQAPTPAGS